MSSGRHQGRVAPGIFIIAGTATALLRGGTWSPTTARSIASIVVPSATRVNIHVRVGGAGTFGRDGEGGGMFVSGETTMALSDCNFTQCVAQVGASSLDSSFTYASGGGLYVEVASTVVLSNSTFTHD